MELKKTELSLCDTITKGTTQAMSDGEVIVPDIKPDILKILQVDAEASVTDRYIENGRLYISGRVDYKVLYIPDSDGEKIKSILTSMDFRQTVDAGGAVTGDNIIASAEVERVEFSATNSRKLRLRSVISIDYEICRVSGTELCTGADEDMECKYDSIDIECTTHLSSHEFTVKERIELPAGQSSISEILKADVTVTEPEYKTVTGKIIIKANADISVLYTDESGAVRFTEAELPFTEVLDAEGVGDMTVCDIDFAVLGVMCEAEEDSDGDLRIAAVDIDICADVRSTENVECKIMRDCFSPYNKTDIEREDINITRTVCRPSIQNSVREIIDVPDNVPGVAGVYNVIADAAVTKSELQGKRLLCEGRIDVYALYLTDSAENPIYSIRKEIPFSYVTECDGASGNEEIELNASVGHIGYSLNSSGDIELRCLVSVDGRLIKHDTISNIVSVETEDMPIRSGIFIYFVKDGDTLWDISKRYAVPRGRIARYNNIAEDVLERGAKLFIPAQM
ncbi:MAG: DUF3794 domain-containing protein [Clostridia bacterium]|nr:DUF3794 domain-containing protein [Clostridia bacterium]